MKDNTAAVVTVGGGRGFVVGTKRGDRLVITAAHCLPHLPTGFSIAYTEERTYAELLSPLGQPPSVWAECLFVDPIADIAVLGSPDGQGLPSQADDWDNFTEAAGVLNTGPCPAEAPAWLLGLEGMWFESPLTCEGRALWLHQRPRPIESGMSGSPMIVDDRAVGVVVTDAGPHPYLVKALPVWMVERLTSG